MSERLRDILSVVVIVAVLLALLIGLRAMRAKGTGAPEAGLRPGVAPATSASAGSERPPATGAEPPAPAPAGSPELSGLAAVPVDAAATAAPEATGRWVPQAPVEFTTKDLGQCGRGVRVDLGRYDVRAGDEFDVVLRFTAPALESCTLVIEYDPAKLAAVPGSAKPIGPHFRGGIECYADKGGGRLVLIHAGTPGKKNLDAVSDVASVTWRMRALQVGATAMRVGQQTSFSNGHGDDEHYAATGGDVSIR